jgi:iron complex outermembrane receptor protein
MNNSNDISGISGVSYGGSGNSRRGFAKYASRRIWPLAAAMLFFSGSGIADTDNSAAAAPLEAAATPGDALETIIVTALRRSEDVQHAAVSVNVLTPDLLAKASVYSVANLTAIVPALQSSNQGGESQMYIRGVGSLSSGGFTSGAVAFNYNGEYIAATNGFNGLFFDVERIEVLKGPQGTLYGRNATGGAVNLITRGAELGTDGGYFGAQYGNYNEILTNGAINTALGDKTAVRFAFQTENHDGYMSDGTDDAKNLSVRLSLNSQLNSDLSVKLVTDYTKLGGRNTGAAILPLGTTPIRGGLSSPEAISYYNNAAANSFIFPGAVVPIPENLSRVDTPIAGVLADIEWRTAFGTLSVVPAYRKLNDSTIYSDPGFFAVIRTHQDQASIEARWASDDKTPFRYLVGAYYFHQHNHLDYDFDGAFLGVFVQKGTLSTSSPAAFSQLTYAITDAFRLTGGVRYTEERKTIDATDGVAAPVVFTSGPGLNPLVIGPPVPSIVTNAARSFTSTTWKAGVEWDVSAESLLYANVSTGFKAGGFFFSQANNSFEPERVTSYTLGSKNRFFSDRLQLNVEAFLLKYRDQQFTHLAFVTGLTGPVLGAPTENVGRSTIKGIETELQWLPTSTSLLSADVQYINSKYDQFGYQAPDISGLLHQAPGAIPPASGCPATLVGGSYQVNCSGYQLIQTPTWTVGATARQTLNLSGGGNLVAEVRLRYESSRWASDTFLPVSRVGGNGTTSASMTYNPASRHWNLGAYVENITNKEVPGSIYAHDTYPIFPLNTATLRPPRTFGVRGRYEF